MEQKRISDLKKGEYFTLRMIEEPKDNQVYIREEYDRSEKKFWVSKFDDVSNGRLMAGSKLVWVGFTF